MTAFNVLNPTTPAHEAFRAHRDLEARLKTLRGEVLFDSGSRALYATDASNYRQIPIGVVLPRDTADVEAALAACRATGAAVLPRGGGTSVAGQCTNVALIFDFSRYMNALIEMDPVAKLAVVEPGIVLDRLREAAEQYGLTYGPDPATHSRCTLGGMIGNNSCGMHGLLAGKTVDNVESLEIVLYDGTRMMVGRTSDEELASIIAAGGRRGAIYAGLKIIRDRYSDLVRQRFPRIPRRVSGYNLDELLPENGFNVARALVGSEGTCASIVAAKLNLTNSPPFRVLTLVGFKDAFLAADAVPLILAHKPIGLEGFDHLLVNYIRRKGIALKELACLPPGAGILLVESGAWSAEEARAKAEAIVADSPRWPGAPVAHICTPEEAAGAWHLRESALGAMMFVPGEPHRVEGWEDAAVDPVKLGNYLRSITALMDEYGYNSPINGHYGQGCIHFRINFDFHTEKGLRDYREFIERATDVVLEHGGSLSGEHGDGQSRAVLLPKMFGPELMEAFREFKRLWDPDNMMNPGKLVDPVRVYEPTENLRLSRLNNVSSASLQNGQGKQESKRSFTPYFAFPRDGGSLENATERCVGVGACRNLDGGVMCPAFRATTDEKHSTRGRAHLLWEMLAGSLQQEGFRSEYVRDALDMCMSCKACKTECPVQVDMTAYKAEFLAQHYEGRLHPLRHYLFGFSDKLARFGSIAPRLMNAVLAESLTGPLIKRIVGIAPQRTLPKLALQSFRKSYTSINPTTRQAFPSSRPVLLWADTWNNYYRPQTLAAALAVLRRAGFEVQVLRRHICCGRPLYDFGFLAHAKSYLEDVLKRLTPQIEARMPIVFLEPSCASVFKNELLEFFPDDQQAEQLGKQVYLLADFLTENAPEWVPSGLEGMRVMIHGHCHHKAVFDGPASEMAMLRRAGANVQLIKSSCCGMAGPYGYESDKFAISKTLAYDGLLPAIEAAESTTVVVADGFSCREQIEQLGHKQAVHLAEILAKGGSLQY